MVTEAPFQTSLFETPSDVSDLLPALIRKDDSILKGISVPTAEDLPLVLHNDLDIRKIKAITESMLVYGLAPTPVRSLHWQRCLGREILPIERLDMHLVWKRQKIFVKPLPRYLLDKGFWEDHIQCDSLCRASVEKLSWPFPMIKEPKCCIRSISLGFLVSYATLVPYESDFSVAKDLHLISEDISWLQWKLFIKELLGPEDILKKIDSRFRLGELPLSALDSAWAWLSWRLSTTYMPNVDRYTLVLEEWFATLATATVFMVVILTSMQVGLATTRLNESQAFQGVSWVFCLLAILGTAIGIVGVLSHFVSIIYSELWVRFLSVQRSRGVSDRTTEI